MIVWGGMNRVTNPDSTTRFEVLSDGALYNPAHDQWTPMTTAGAPSRRSTHTAVWTGTKMIAWGGWEQTTGLPNLPEDGAVYDPAAESWAPMSRVDAPPARYGHTAIWTGRR